MKWSEGRELSKDLKDTIELFISSEGMKEFDCPACGETFGSTEESYKDGYCGMCEFELRQELKDSHGIEHTDDTYLTNRFIDLFMKGQHEPLTDSEMKEWDELKDELGIEDCDNCEGEGYRSFPSPMGGYDSLKCKKCDGYGMLNIPNDLKNI